MQPHRRILASTVLALILGAPVAAFAQGANRLAATFNERYPTEQAPTRIPPEQKPTQPPAEQAPSQPPTEQKPVQSPPEQTGTQPPAARAPMQRPAEAEPPVAQPHRRPDAAQAKYVQNKYTDNVRPARSVNPRRAPSRVVVVPRSFLDAGTEVEPGERKFLDYALPPLHTPMDVVTNTGGRVGWHNSPLPGPFFPMTN